jgi:hypothetical protein
MSLKLRGKALDVAGFDEHVQFAEDRAFKLLDQVDRPYDAAQVEGPLEPGGKIVHHLDVFADALFDPRADHLHSHLLTGFQSGGVHLGHGCGGHGRLVDTVKKLVQGLAQFGLDQAANPVEGHRRHLVLQLGQLVDVFRGKQVGTGAHQLPQLDKTGAQLFQGFADADRIGKSGFDLGAGSSLESIGDFAHAVLDEHTRNQAKMANTADAVAGKGKRHGITFKEKVEIFFLGEVQKITPRHPPFC